MNPKFLSSRKDSRRSHKKGLRSVPLFYNELKKHRTILLTDTVVSLLDQENLALNKSRSELLEVILRERYNLS
jgi:hypothetical protein